MSDSNIECHYFKEKAHHVKKKSKKKKNTFLCDKCVNKVEDCVCSVNEAVQDWLNESESENVGNINRQATVGKAITTIR